MKTPLAVEILIHFATSLGPHPRIEAPAVQETVDSFVRDGILAPQAPSNNPVPAGHKAPGFVMTTKGRAWLAMILATPYPESRFVDPRSGVEVKTV